MKYTKSRWNPQIKKIQIIIERHFKLDGFKIGTFLHLGSLSLEAIFEINYKNFFTEDPDVDADKVEIKLSYQKLIYNDSPNILKDWLFTDDINIVDAILM